MKKIIVTLLVALMAMPLSSSLSSASAKSAATEKVADKKPNKADKKKKDLRTLVLSADIHCKSCSNKIMDNIAFEKGVTDLKVSVEQKTIELTYDAAKTSEEALLASLKKIGYPAQVLERK